MRSTFSGLDIAYRALQAQQQVIDVINHNIANASTPGYSRQVADLATTTPYTLPTMTMNVGAGQMGTGVAVVDVRRTRLSFMDYQIRGESQTLGQWEKMRDALQQVEVILNEPSDSGLNSLLSKFFQSWQDLSNNPQDMGARSALVEQSKSLAVAFNNKYTLLTNIQQDLDRQMRTETDTINDLADRIASLNTQIAEVELVGQKANDLRDQRDLVLDELSKIVRVTYFEGSQGAVNVFLGSRELVYGTRSNKIAVVNDSNSFANIVWADDQSSVTFTDGELYGLQQARDVELPNFLNQLDQLAGQIIAEVNNLHYSDPLSPPPISYDLDSNPGLQFFIGSGAKDMAVNPVIAADPRKVAAAANVDAPGDNTVARSIAALQKALTMEGGTTDFGRYLASIISRLGVDSQRADTMARNQKLLVDHLDRQRQSVTGVSLDEETTQLIEHQRAYQAASRVINAIDEMLDKLINGTGLVGR